jgi:TPR repeat protein
MTIYYLLENSTDLANFCLKNGIPLPNNVGIEDLFTSFIRDFKHWIPLEENALILCLTRYLKEGLVTIIEKPTKRRGRPAGTTKTVHEETEKPHAKRGPKPKIKTVVEYIEPQPTQVRTPRPATVVNEDVKLNYVAIGDQHYFDKDYPTAVRYYQLASDQDDPEGEYDLGYCYEHGLGVEKDYALAYQYYLRAAKQSQADALCNLGVFFEHGYYVAQNYDQAFIYFQQSANLGSDVALVNLGNCYKYGRGTPINLSGAFNCYLQAAKHDNESALCNLGVCYKNGVGVEVSYFQAIKYYKLAIDRGSIIALYDLAVCYENGQGVEKNNQLAFYYYEAAAKKGYQAAIDKIANFPV